MILSFATSSTVLTPAQPIRISVVLTDPDGVDDVIGGTLLDTEDRAYGTFATTAGEGAYEVTLTWSDANAVETISQQPETGLRRSLIARFFDGGGQQVERSFEIVLQCGFEGGLACGGACVDARRDRRNCGACDWSCPGNNCQNGICRLGDVRAEEGESTCDEVCAGEASGEWFCDASLDEVRDPGRAEYQCFKGLGRNPVVAIESCDQVVPETTECETQDEPATQRFMGCICWLRRP
ncbi:MAG: hypothetical protein AAF938_14835 [Myxococcota bacterium]